MTDRVSEVSNLWRGRLVLDIATVDLVEIAGEVCRELEGDAVAADAVLVFAPTPPVIGAWDRQRLKWIAANLLSNAIRYAGGRIEVSVEDLGTMAQLSVRDAGPGIAPAALSQLFEPFGPRAASGTPAGGFGVGLWVTRQLCSAMQGSVTVETPSSGGACFSVQLPRGT
jgi:signal transduction histidine kinase